jgi:hypothetical protein
VQRILPLDLEEKEKAQFLKGAKTIREGIAAIEASV